MAAERLLKAKKVTPRVVCQNVHYLKVGLSILSIRCRNLLVYGNFLVVHITESDF